MLGSFKFFSIRPHVSSNRLADPEPAAEPERQAATTEAAFLLSVHCRIPPMGRARPTQHPQAAAQQGFAWRTPVGAKGNGAVPGGMRYRAHVGDALLDHAIRVGVRVHLRALPSRAGWTQRNTRTPVADCGFTAARHCHPYLPTSPPTYHHPHLNLTYNLTTAQVGLIYFGTATKLVVGAVLLKAYLAGVIFWPIGLVGSYIEFLFAFVFMHGLSRKAVKQRQG